MEFSCNNGHIIAYNGQVIAFEILEKKSNPVEKNVLAFSRKTFNVETGQFNEIFIGEYNIPSSKSTLELVCVRCVADSRTGIRLPCILLRTCKRKSSGSSRLISLLLHPSNVVEPSLMFKVDSETIEDLYVTDGPTVLWRQHETLLYVSSLTSEVVMAPINISALLWAGTTEEGTCILGITAVRLDGSHLTSSSLPNRTLQGKEFILYCIDSRRALPGSCLLPHAYTCVLQCLEVCRIQNVNGRYETSAIAASNKQLIWFHNGVPKQVCQLPSENLSKLQVAYTSHADVLCVLLFSSGHACGIWKDGWKTAAAWQHVRNILVDDFLCRGSDQVLLLFNDYPRESSEHQAFRLTDCGDINYPADRVDVKVNESQENHFLMLQTLEARLQANFLLLEELQRHTQVQDRVLESSCDALIDMSLDVKSSIRSAEKEGLVSLWDDVENCPYPPAPKSHPDSEQLVKTIWHRIVDDFLVVGVRLKSSVPEMLSDIGLSLIMDQKGTQPSLVTKCQTNVLKLAISVSQDSRTMCYAEPTAKKQRLDYHRSWSLEDIFAILSAFQKCSLHLLSRDCTLTSVTEWMRAHMCGEPLKLMPPIMVCKKDGPLHGTLLAWDPKTPCEGNLTVFYRNNSVLLQCLHSLKCVLPPTCVVNVMKQGDRNTLTMNLAQSMEEELCALQNLVSAAASEVKRNLSLNCQAGEKVTSTADGISGTKDQVQRYREDLRAEQARIRLGEHLSASREIYRHNALNIAQIQMKSDAFACNVANI
ncbi:Fanconi anemia group B protein isoform X2 [Hyla sarda]|uniref:Fanconi anemia group B protein isoform X2 n=1 Tax=Hyla sarda TaxID=327740 RepID=UPI0024C38759|nr:Fanconi anemia group B protein isoform X2 [Hyla sarda]